MLAISAATACWRTRTWLSRCRARGVLLQVDDLIVSAQLADLAVDVTQLLGGARDILRHRAAGLALIGQADAQAEIGVDRGAQRPQRRLATGVRIAHGQHRRARHGRRTDALLHAAGRQPHLLGGRQGWAQSEPLAGCEIGKQRRDADLLDQALGDGVTVQQGDFAAHLSGQGITRQAFRGGAEGLVVADHQQGLRDVARL